MPFTRQCNGSMGPAPPRPPGAWPAGTSSAREIAISAPGIWNRVRSAHLLEDWANAVPAANVSKVYRKIMLPRISQDSSCEHTKCAGVPDNAPQSFLICNDGADGFGGIAFEAVVDKDVRGAALFAHAADHGAEGVAAFGVFIA